MSVRAIRRPYLCDKGEGKFRAASITLLVALAGVQFQMSSATGQTLPQTVAYVLSGGMVEPSNMKFVDDDTVQVPGYLVGLTNLMPAMTVRVINRAKCEIQYEPLERGTGKKMNLYLNNVIPSETRDAQGESNALYRTRMFYLVGDEAIYCTEYNSNKSCFRTLDTPAYEENMSRIYRALKHLYAEYCQPARRKGAF